MVINAFNDLFVRPSEKLHNILGALWLLELFFGFDGWGREGDSLASVCIRKFHSALMY